MDWTDDFVFDESLYDLLSSPQLEVDPKETEWTFDEHRLFESVVAEVGPTSPTLIETIASRIPWKSFEDVKNHYQQMFEDFGLMESGNVPYPDYPDMINAADQAVPMMPPNKDDDDVVVAAAAASDPKGKSTAQRRRGVPWTEDEHQLFLMGLNKYGKGDWRSISRYYVISKTPTQVASHAQKYFRRLTSSTPADRRRPSIHDIQTVSPTPTPIPQRPTTLSTTVDPPPPLPNYGYINPSMYMQQQQQQNINPMPMPMMNNPSYMNINNPNYDAGHMFSHSANGAGPSNYADIAGPSNYADAGPSNYAEAAAAYNFPSPPFYPSMMDDQQYWG